MIPLPELIPVRFARLIRLADRRPHRAVPKAYRALKYVPAGDSEGRTWAIYTLGWALLRWERLDEADGLLKQARDDFIARGLTVPALHAQYGVLLTALLYGAKAELYDAWEALATAYDQQHLAVSATWARCYQCGLLNILGRSREALTLAETIKPRLTAPGTQEEQGRLALMIAVAHGGCDEFDQAMVAVEQALDIFTQLDMPIEVARCMLERSWLLQRRERFAPALADLEQAQAIFTEIDMPMRLAFCDQHIGLLESRLGHYDQALAATTRARSVFVTCQRADLVAHCDLHIGIVAYYCGLFDLALRAYEWAKTTYITLGMAHQISICQRNIALVLRSQAQPDAALVLLNNLVEPATRLGERMELAEILYAQALTLRDLGHTHTVLPLLLRAHRLFMELSNPAAAAECVLEQGWLYLEQQQFAQAAEYLRAARLELADRPAHHWRADYGLGRCAMLQGQTETALLFYRAASASIAQLRRLQSEHASSAIFTQARLLFDEAITLAAQCNDPHAILEFAEQHRAVVLQQQHHRSSVHRAADLTALQRESLGMLNTSLPDSADLDHALSEYIHALLQFRHTTAPHPDLAPAVFDLDALRRAFDQAYPAGWASLVYVMCGERLLIVLIDSQTATLSSTPVDRELRRLLKQCCLPEYREFTYLDLARQGDPTQPAWAGLAQLGDRLLPDALRARLHPDFRLLIVAGDPLHGLPWSALRLDESWLIERAVVQLLPSLPMWTLLAGRAATGNAALLLGCNTFGSRAPDLPHALPSLDMVQQHWPGAVKRFEQALVVRQQILDLAAAGQLRQYRLIHFATHGQLVAARGLLAHLKLFDNDLLYDEITRLNLAGALVVLAACEGAAGEVLPGEEVLSLNRAFLAAGASDVIASLWQMYDEAVLGVIVPLYQALAAGEDAARALATMQRAIIAESCMAQEDLSVTTSPLVWATFCVVGAGVASAGGTTPANVGSPT